MGPQSHMLSLILALVGDFLCCPDRKFSRAWQTTRTTCRDRRMHDSLGIDLLCKGLVYRREIVPMTWAQEPDCPCSHLGLLAYRLYDSGQSYC